MLLLLLTSSRSDIVYTGKLSQSDAGGYVPGTAEHRGVSEVGKDMSVTGKTLAFPRPHDMWSRK